MIVLRTTSASDTRALGEAVAGVASSGDVVALIGDLGAGKTTFAQGFGRGLGVAEPITSPTFVLLRHYPGRLDLLHADVYRLDALAEVVDLGLNELLDLSPPGATPQASAPTGASPQPTGVVALVEWGDMAAPVLGPDYLEVRLDHPDALSPGGSDRRRIVLHPVGPCWNRRWANLELAVDPWRAQ